MLLLRLAGWPAGWRDDAGGVRETAALAAGAAAAGAPAPSRLVLKLLPWKRVARDPKTSVAPPGLGHKVRGKN